MSGNALHSAMQLNGAATFCSGVQGTELGPAMPELQAMPAKKAEGAPAKKAEGAPAKKAEGAPVAPWWSQIINRKNKLQVLYREISYRTEVAARYHGVKWMWEDDCEYTPSIRKPYGHMRSREANNEKIEKLKNSIANCNKEIEDLQKKVDELSAEMTRRKNDRNDRRGGPRRSERLAKRTQPY